MRVLLWMIVGLIVLVLLTKLRSDHSVTTASQSSAPQADYYDVRPSTPVFVSEQALRDGQAIGGAGGGVPRRWLACVVSFRSKVAWLDGGGAFYRHIHVIDGQQAGCDGWVDSDHMEHQP